MRTQITPLNEIKQRVEFSFTTLFKLENNDYPTMAEALVLHIHQSGTYLKPTFKNISEAKAFISNIIEAFQESDQKIFCQLLSKRIEDVIDRNPDEKTALRLGKKLIKHWTKTNKDLLNYLNNKVTPADEEVMLFTSKNAENQFFDCGIRHEIFSKNKKFLSKKGFAFGMMQAFVERNLTEIKESRIAVKSFFKYHLNLNYKDPRKKQHGKESKFFNDGYEAALIYIEANYKN